MALDQDLKCSIIDRIFVHISEGLSKGGEQVTGKIPWSFRQFANELHDRKHHKICMAHILRRNAKISKAYRGLTSEKLREDDLELIEVLKVHY